MRLGAGMRNDQFGFMTVPDDERDGVRRFARLLRDLLSGKSDGKAALRVTAPDGTRVETELSAETLEIIERTIECASDGEVAVLARNDALSPQEAAVRIGVSRSFLTRQMDAGRLPFHLAGTHRRVKVGDLVAFNQRLSASDAAMDRLINNVDGLPESG